MSRLNIILAESNTEYCDSMFDYFNNHFQHQFRMDCFSDYDLLTGYLSTLSHTVDILLISIDFFVNDIAAIVKDKVKVVIELKENTEPGKSKYKSINKYTGMDQMAKMMLDIYTDEYDPAVILNKADSMQKNTQVIMVCSPEGGSGKTVISSALAIIYSLRGKVPFYLNLERFYSPIKLFNPASVRGLSDILFYIRNNDKNLPLKINSCVLKEPSYNIDYLSPVSTPLDLDEMNTCEMQILLQQIILSKPYDAIIIDTDVWTDPIDADIMDICTKIVIPYTFTKYGMEKLKTYISYIERKVDNEILKKLIILTANKSVNVCEEQFNSYIKVPVPLPHFIEGIDDFNIISKHKAMSELYNVINLKI